jgi:hypothetical protein
LGNPLPKTTVKGTYGELLVILRLLDFDVQACFTLKDSGNDLIAIKGSNVQTIQVKSTLPEGRWDLRNLHKKRYDVLALVSLIPKKRGFDLEKSKIFLLKNSEVDNRSVITNNMKIEKYSLNKEIIQKLFPEKFN